MLVPGSQNSFIADNGSVKLGAESLHKLLNISGICLNDSVAYQKVNVSILSKANYELKLSLFVLPKIMCDLPLVEMNFNKWYIFQEITWCSILQILWNRSFNKCGLLLWNNGIFRLGRNLPIP